MRISNPEMGLNQVLWPVSIRKGRVKTSTSQSHCTHDWIFPKHKASVR
jgi:hypothetical protein